jgi:murein DD-endopeptidase MepM/ murein hydrolase activator NlpD
MKRDFIFSILLSFVLITLVDSFCQMRKPEIQLVDVSKNHKISVLEYGLPVDSFIIQENKILAGTSFSTLINALNIKPEVIHSIIEKASHVFDLRKIKKGNIYKVFLSKDSLKTVDYLVYEHSPTDYIFFNFKDTVHVEKRQKEVVTQTHTASGTIESSLWNAIVVNGGDPMLAIKLSDVYAWSIDFFGLQKGDMFKVCYETRSIEGSIIEISKIHAAWFKHMGKEYYAIPFYQDSTINFYDEQGNNIKKAFLKAPLNYSRIASHFSNSRFHPILKIFRPHHGVDYCAAMGTPVQSIGDGIVLHASYSGGGGNFVKIRHNGTYTTGYMHLSRYGQGIRPGKHVQQGEIIGYVGSTGLSTGPHLDFRVWKNDEPIDPLKLESPPAKPVKKEDLGFFFKIRDVWKGELDKIVVPDLKTDQPIADNK